MISSIFPVRMSLNPATSSKSVSFYLYARLCAGYSRSMIRQKSNFPIKEQEGKTALPFLARYNSTSSHSFFVI
jgi:hypothetical protein